MGPSNSPVGNMVYTSSNGSTSSSPFIPILETRDPTSADINYSVKQFWVNLEAENMWVLTSFTGTAGILSANWALCTTSDSLTEFLVPSGTSPVTPVAGEITLTSTDGSVTISGGAGSINFTVDETQIDAVQKFTVPSGTTTVTPAVSTGNINITSSDSSMTITGSANTVDLKANQTVVHSVRQITPISGTSPVVPSVPTGDISITSGDGSINAVGGTNTLALSVNSTGISFTPTISFGGGTTGLTYTLQKGVYLKIGKLVYIFGQITINTKGSSTGKARIAGSPIFPTNNSSFPANIAFNMDAAITLDTGFTGLFGFIPAGVAEIQPYEQGSNQTSFFLDHTYFANGSSFEFCGTYYSD